MPGTLNGEPTRAAETFTLPDFPRNAWYAAAYDVELKHELLPRTICGHQLVMYRKTDGTPVALENACWHRLLPLSEGSLEGDELVCGYHGLMYNGEGRCTFMPSQKTINPAARVRAYPVVERHRFVWVWTGDPALADPATVPDLHWNDDPEWEGDGKRIHAECNYKLVVDNLMDLTHETFVHGSSIGQRSILEVPFEVTHGPDFATVTRWMRDVDRRRSGSCSWSGRRASRSATSTAGRSSTSRRRRPSRSTSASPRPARALPRAIARRASTATCSTR